MYFGVSLLCLPFEMVNYSSGLYDDEARKKEAYASLPLGTALGGIQIRGLEGSNRRTINPIVFNLPHYVRKKC